MTINLKNPEIARVISNNMRMIIGFLVGLYVVKGFLRFGEDAYQVYVLVVLGAGVGIMVRELLRLSLLSYISRSYAQERNFHSVFSFSKKISVIFSLGSFFLLISLIVFFDNFDVDAEYFASGAWFVFFRAILTALLVLVAPFSILLLVTGRQVASNIFLTLERASEFLVMMLCLEFFSHDQGQSVLFFFGLGTALFSFFIALFIYSYCKRFVAFPSCLEPIDKTMKKGMVASLWWALVIVMSMNLYFRFDVFFIGLYWGGIGVVVIGLAIQLTGMIRQMTVGFINGLDAVYSKLSYSRGSSSTGKNVVYYMSSLQCIVVFSALAFIYFHSEFLIDLWVGNEVKDQRVIELTSDALLIMMFGIAARAISEVWASALTGTGKVKNYAVIIAPGAVLNVLLCFSLLAFFSEQELLIAVAGIFTLLQVVFNLVALSFLVVKEAGFTIRELYYPILKPFLFVVMGCAFSLFVKRCFNSGDVGYLFFDMALLSFVGLLFVFSLMKKGAVEE